MTNNAPTTPPPPPPTVTPPPSSGSGGANASTKQELSDEQVRQLALVVMRLMMHELRIERERIGGII